MKTYHDGVKHGYERGRAFALKVLEEQIDMIEKTLLEEVAEDAKSVWAIHNFASDLQGFINVIKR